jgi:hypothetical protein
VSGIPHSVEHPVLEQENAVLLAEVHQRSSLYNAEDGDPQREERGLTLNLTKTAYLLIGKPGGSLSLETKVKTPQLFGRENETEKYEFENQGRTNRWQCVSSTVNGMIQIVTRIKPNNIQGDS